MNSNRLKYVALLAFSISQFVSGVVLANEAAISGCCAVSKNPEQGSQPSSFNEKGGVSSGGSGNDYYQRTSCFFREGAINKIHPVQLGDAYLSLHCDIQYFDFRCIQNAAAEIAAKVDAEDEALELLQEPARKCLKED